MARPISIILKKSDKIGDVVSAGLDTVAVRMPSHPVALAVIQAAGVPVAAPSANTSGKPSPTTARHVRDDMYGKIDMIIDGGRCGVGVESTVLDLSGGTPGHPAARRYHGADACASHWPGYQPGGAGGG